MGTGSFPGGKAAGAWCWQLTKSSAEVKERVQLYLMCSYCYIYVFLLWSVYSVLCSVRSVFIVPTGTLRLPWLRFFRAFSSVVRQMSGYNSQKTGHGPHSSQINCVVLCIVFKCVLYYRHRVSTQPQLTKTYLNLCPRWDFFFCKMIHLLSLDLEIQTYMIKVHLTCQNYQQLQVQF